MSHVNKLDQMYTDLLKQFGLDDRLMKLAEESAELAAAIVKWTHTQDPIAMDNLFTEFAQVFILMNTVTKSDAFDQRLAKSFLEEIPKVEKLLKS